MVLFYEKISLNTNHHLNPNPNHNSYVRKICIHFGYVRT